MRRLSQYALDKRRLQDGKPDGLDLRGRGLGGLVP
jgi:hypothetical protein